MDRLIDVFPSDQQAQIRSMFSESLAGIISQVLVKKKDGTGRACALEILVAIPAIRNQIREGQTHQIPTTIEASAKVGMQTMDRALLNLFRDGRIARETLMINAKKPDEMVRLIKEA